MQNFDDPTSVDPEIQKNLDLIRKSGLLEIYNNPSVVSSYKTVLKASEFLNSSVFESAAQASKIRELYDDSTLAAFHEASKFLNSSIFESATQTSKIRKLYDDSTLASLHEASVLASKFINPVVLEFAQNALQSPMAEFIKNNHILSSVLDRSEIGNTIGSQILNTIGVQVDAGTSINELLSQKIKSSFSDVSKSDVSNDSDYVTLPESTVKEICVPETIAIPAGNYRIKIGTEFFISLLITIIQLTINLLPSISPQLPSLSDEEQLKCRQAQKQVLHWQNYSIHELLRDIDTSVSSQAESLQGLKESVEDHHSEIQVLLESDAVQNSEIQELWSEIQELKLSQHSGESSPDNTNVSGNTVPEE